MIDENVSNGEAPEEQETGADASADTTTDQSDSADSDTGSSPELSGNREAAKYRRQLRDVETERDQLKSLVDSYRKTEVERRVSDALEDPRDLWLSGVALADVLGEDGTVDESKLDAVVLRVTSEHPAWRKRPVVGVDFDQGKTSDHSVSPSWTSLLRSGRQD